MTTIREDTTTAGLVKRALDGDERAWHLLVEQYAPLVWSICRRYRLSSADADEVGGNVWLRLVEGLDKLRTPGALPAWLATVTRRECLRVLGAPRTQIIADDGVPDENVAAADEELLRQERLVALRLAYAGLPERCRRLLALLFADPPAPYAEISGKLGIRVGGIGPTRQRCIAALRDSPAMAPFVDSPKA